MTSDWSERQFIHFLESARYASAAAYFLTQVSPRTPRVLERLLHLVNSTRNVYELKTVPCVNSPVVGSIAAYKEELKSLILLARDEPDALGDWGRVVARMRDPIFPQLLDFAIRDAALWDRVLIR